MKRNILILIFSLLTTLMGLFLKPDNLKANDKMDWFHDAKYGMFIHWGAYAQLGRGEFALFYDSIPQEEYRKIASQFNPIEFNADSVVLLAKRNGMKYIVFTAKHCEGFSMWDTKYSDFDIMDLSPLKRDIVKEISEACAKYDLKFGVYYAILEWSHPLSKSKELYKRLAKEFFLPQIIELINNYKIDLIWFDGGWISEWQNEYGDEIEKEIFKINPNIIINNRLWRAGNTKGDFVIYEELIPENIIDNNDWESCTSINFHWGYCSADNDWKSKSKLLEALLEIISKGGNFLLNCAIDSHGNLQKQAIERYEFIGNWMNKYGNTIYGTQPNKIFKENFGLVTHKDSIYFLHVLKRGMNNRINFPFICNETPIVQDFITGKYLTFIKLDSMVIIDTQNLTYDSVASVIKFICNGEPIINNYVIESEDNTYNASIDFLHPVGKSVRIGTLRQISSWVDKDDYVYFDVFINKSLDFDLIFEYSQAFWNDQKKIGVIIQNDTNSDTLVFYSNSTWDWYNFQTFNHGTIKINTGLNRIKIISLDTIGSLINLTLVKLVPHDIVVTNNLSIDKFDISVYPNPASNYINFCFVKENNSTAQINIFDVLGNLINSIKSSIFEKDEMIFTWNLMDIHGRKVVAGIFYYQLLIDNKIICSNPFIVIP